jgi:deoxyribodipyrimidine photo-lyase
VFNPILQGEKFDPDGSLRPALGPGACRVAGQADPPTLDRDAARARRRRHHLGKTYPERLIDYKAGRERALAAYAKVRAG